MQSLRDIRLDLKQTVIGGVRMKNQREKPIITDPFGSYTGLPTVKDEVPVQDVDDL